MTGPEMDAAFAEMSKPSNVHLWLVNNTEVCRGQLRDMLPGRHWIAPKDDKEPLMAVYAPADAVPVGMFIFADDDISGGDEPKAISVFDEHKYLRSKGSPWPWEASQ